MTTATISNSAVCCPPYPANQSRNITRTLWDLIKQWHKQQRAAQCLAQLSNEQLKDIGLQRSEINPVVYGAAADRIHQLELS